MKRQVAQQAEELAILKKYHVGRGVLREKPKVKYSFMRVNTGKFNITAQSAAFGVSRCGYYAWRRRQAHPGKRRLAREALDRLVSKAFHARRGRSGAPGLTLDLADAGDPHDRKTVAASMRRQGLVAKAGRKFKATTDSRYGLPVAFNLLAQDFSAAAPNQKWVCDITYLRTTEGWLYLAVVIDLFSRMVVGWSMAKRMKADLVCDALEMALWRRRKRWTPKIGQSCKV